MRSWAELAVDTIKGTSFEWNDVNTQRISKAPGRDRPVDDRATFFLSHAGASCLSDFVLVEGDEPSERPVIGLFDVVRKKTRRKLLHAPVILEALAANAFSAAWFVGAVAERKILVLVTVFHFTLKCSNFSCFHG
jgi:hypothetical protein